MDQKKFRKQIKVNKQFIADDQATLKSKDFNQTPYWHTFYQNVM